MGSEEEARPYPRTPPLAARNLSVSGAGEVLVRDASFEVGPGEAVALVPAIPGDVTPLLDVLAGMAPPDSGEISWSGTGTRDIADASSPGARYRLEREVRLSTGYLTPHASLLHNQTLFENIALPLRYHLGIGEDEVCSRVEDAIRSLRLEAYALRRPSEVPRAIRWKAELARALILEPPLLLVDSPYLDGDRAAAPALGSHLELRIRAGTLALVAAVEEPARVSGLFTRALVVDGGRMSECRRTNDGTPLSRDVERRMQVGSEGKNAKETV